MSQPAQRRKFETFENAEAGRPPVKVGSQTVHNVRFGAGSRPGWTAGLGAKQPRLVWQQAEPPAATAHLVPPRRNREHDTDCLSVRFALTRL